MKQRYVKPMIECEEFVANEYVANCWEVTTEHHGTFRVKNRPNFEILGFPNPDDGFYYAYVENNGSFLPHRVYEGSFYVGGEEMKPEHKILDSDTLVHIVTDYKERKGDGPNAS